MSPTVEPWRCVGNQYRHVRTGALSATFTTPSPFTRKGIGQRGLVSVDAAAMATYAQYGPDAYVFKVDWNTVEPSPGVYSWTAIDNALTNNGNARMTLRIQAGGSAPNWMKDQLGRITITNSQLGNSTVVTKFWESVALNAWDAMIRAAGARYDSNPKVTLVSSDEAMTLYSEPLILGGHDPSAIALYNAGLNEDTHRNAIMVSTASTIAAFPTTHVEFAGHSSWQRATANGVIDSWPPARTLLNDLDTLYGSQLVFTSYGLDSTDYATSYPPAASLAAATNYYSWMRTRRAAGRKIGFQLTLGAGQTHTGEERWEGAKRAQEFGGDFVEHSSWGTIINDGTVPNGATELTAVDSQLKTNAGS